MLVLFVCLQFIFWLEIRHIEPDMGIVPEVPGRAEIHALTFGDDEFYFRVLAFIIQNCGDTYGRFSPLRYYDMNKLYYWWGLLDELDARSNMMPAMASYYFSQTQNQADVRYIVDYLYTHASRDVEHKWWWLLQAIYLAMHKINDMDLAMKVAAPLVNDKVPVWAQQMAAVVHEKRGEMGDALRIMENIRDHAKDISDADLKFMTYFVKERLHKLEKMEKEKPSPAPDTGSNSKAP